MVKYTVWWSNPHTISAGNKSFTEKSNAMNFICVLKKARPYTSGKWKAEDGTIYWLEVETR